MDALRDRAVLVEAGALDDLLELVDRAIDRLPEDALTHALAGAVGDVRAHALLDVA